MGRTKGTLICPKCKTANPCWYGRVVDGCKRCFYRFPKDKELLKIYKKQKEDGIPPTNKLVGILPKKL